MFNNNRYTSIGSGVVFGLVFLCAANMETMNEDAACLLKRFSRSGTVSDKCPGNRKKFKQKFPSSLTGLFAFSVSPFNNIPEIQALMALSQHFLFLSLVPGFIKVLKSRVSAKELWHGLFILL